jgi:hypothetical protein
MSEGYETYQDAIEVLEEEMSNLIDNLGANIEEVMSLRYAIGKLRTLRKEHTAVYMKLTWAVWANLLTEHHLSRREHTNE